MGGDGGEPDQEQRDEERERIQEGHEEVKPEPGVTAGLDEFTEEERRQEPAGVMPGAGPDEEPGPDRDGDGGGGGQKEDSDE